MAESSLSLGSNATGIYEIVNTTNGKRYVGSAKNFKKRWQSHLAKLRSGLHHSKYLQSSWSKHGAEAFQFRKLIICEAKDLILYEQICIDSICPAFNIARIAGNTLGTRRSAETRAKISEKAKGRKCSEESKAKMSASLKGRKLSKEHAAKLLGNQHAKGTRLTDERRAEISAFMTGMKRPKSQVHRQKIAASLTGRKLSEEHRANQSLAQKGKPRAKYKPMSDETKCRIAAQRKLRPEPLLGRKKSPQAIEAVAMALRGRKLSDEHRKNISAGSKSIWSDPEKRAFILQRQAESRAAKPRAPMPQETRLKISKSTTGRKASEATRKKMSEAHTGRPCSDARRQAIIKGKQRIKSLGESG